MNNSYQNNNENTNISNNGEYKNSSSYNKDQNNGSLIGALISIVLIVIIGALVYKFVILKTENNIDKLDSKPLQEEEENAPTAVITIKEKSKGKIVLSAEANDAESDIYGYNWNNKGWSKSSTYEVTKSGTYTVIVRDTAGNESVKESITIPASEFDNTAKKVNRTYKVTFDGNSATVTQSELSCSTTGTGCSITLPNITKNGWIIVGYAESKDAKTAKYKANQKITITSNKKLYAITKLTVKATFNKNGATSVGQSSVTCNLYNTKTSCDITMPSITKSGWTIVGYADSAAATTKKYAVSEKINISSNKTFYAITSKTVTATFNGNGATV